jgi:preprotein translocase subunit SecA
LKNAAAAVKEAMGSDLSGIELDEILTVAFDTTEADEDPDYINKLRDAAESVKNTFASVLSEEKEAVKQSGGLYVMGTNRHESSRIDKQLRGRSGRQGDPGTSRFFLSFEDDMFVIFGGDGLKKILDMFRVSSDMPVEAPQVTDALDKVQRTVEEKYREIRNEIFNFDNTLNSQRRVIYSRRRGILFSSAQESLELMKQYNELAVADIVKAQTVQDGTVNVVKVLEKIAQFFPPVQNLVRASDLHGKDQGTIISFVTVAVDECFNNAISQQETRALASGAAPFSLGRSSNYILLLTMDNAWSEHLQAMENLKESVLLRKYQGRDPVSEYQNESFKLFQGLEQVMRFNAVFSLWQSLAPTVQPATQTA